MVINSASRRPAERAAREAARPYEAKRNASSHNAVYEAHKLG